MGPKLDQFKQRATDHGQDITLYPFLAFPTGAYIDPWSDEPDPDSASYPASRPEPTYDTAVTVRGFWEYYQAGKHKEYLREVTGERINVVAIFYGPGDQTYQLRDKVVYGGESYWIAQLMPWLDGSDPVHTEIILEKIVPRA